MKQAYFYEGPVMSFDRCIHTNWEGYTYAESEKKAKNNLAYRYKMTHGLAPNAEVKLPGKIQLAL